MRICPRHHHNMALTKILNIGDEVNFNCGDEQVTVKLTGQAGRNTVILHIQAPKSVGIMTVGSKKTWVGAPS